MKTSSSTPALGGMKASHSAANLILGGTNGRPGSAGGLAREYRMKMPGDGRSSWIENFVARQVQRPPAEKMVHPLSSMTKVEFRHTGGHGLKCEGLIVKSVADQAAKLGIQVGWKIYSVDGEVVKTEDEVWARLQEAKWEWRSCYVMFVTNIRAIRAEQVMIRAQEMKEQEHRLANLPFAGPHDLKHLEQVREQYVLKGVIEAPEERGITVMQLKEVLEWAKTKCHRWRDFQTMKKLHLDFMTTSHFYEWLVKPVCYPRDVDLQKDYSLVEMLSATKQPPKWYIIHWWGDRVLDLVKAMDAHIKLIHGDAAEYEATKMNFWLAACAMRPHSEAKDPFQLDIMATCFYKAMALAEFRVLLAFDRKAESGNGQSTGPATPIHRAWCQYEMMMCLDNEETDMYLVMLTEQKPLQVTMRMTKMEADNDYMNAGAGLKAKTEREKPFSIDLVEQALALNVMNSKSTDPWDKQKILNVIAQQADLTQMPLLKSDLYTKANIRLCALFAILFWRRTMSGASSDSDMLRVQTALAECLRADVWRKTLSLSLAFVAGGDEKIGLLVKALPPNLRALTLDLRGMDITNESISLLAGALPRELEEIKINLSNNEQITNAGIESFAGKLPPKIKSNCFNLDLENTSVTKEMKDNRRSLEAMQKFIIAENEKGNTCITMALCPSNVKGRMIPETYKCKIFPPAQ
eukprot:TRINITY_DN82775_c0_g1_i1.p1 TRINITY_DN82775_c0_g1~~TRINITY_DN82775_c0_g1_i1.p1  ORF type:complete len:691 (+),score=217.74 TRINITY_DN82775_c0_g1_i1:110-2182(+)